MSSPLPPELELHYTHVEDNWYRCQHSKEAGGTCNTKVYYSEQNPSDLLNHEEEHQESDTDNTDYTNEPSSSSPERQLGNSSSGSGGDIRPDKPEKKREAVDSLSTSTAADLKNTISSIDQGKRVDGRFILHVDSVSVPKNERKTYELQISDLDGEQSQLDIWKKHNLTADWHAGNWYVLEELRDSSWTNGSGQTTRRLSSTRDLEVTNLGSDVDIETSIKGNDEDRDDEIEQTGGNVRSESLLDKIVSEFNDT